ncbi:cobalamin (vitamin B12) biosynthesis CbiM protein [Thermocrinis albus DSM 14484]|uniref:Cobalamin (Vitamin B12) biosynthesis CbiM protein n=1 Tax=Thermocrinis albus (strain DSM 14484 / JCM 11386 / HI 11/12) TaxID=638303 RepID=D3SLQ1_THEAH|nr:energy-coupling factor ABC transporter permease [Thermocrinis albus]ADC89681.1 cobalamin (vitamin B12) biosynthesis CbiM protein [Thermocrinis albus DSM 14484]
MHIPDGFVAPHVYVPAYGVSITLFIKYMKEFKKRVGSKSMPLLALLSAFSFSLMSITLPLPGGTSVHLEGIAVMSILMGPAVAFVCTTIILFLQAFLLGVGGVTTLPINLLAMGFIGGQTAYHVHRIIQKMWGDTPAVLISAYLSVLVPAILIGLVLGIHPILFRSASGQPLYFPYPLSVTLPALIVPHALAGLLESLYTLLIIRRVKYEG